MNLIEELYSLQDAHGFLRDSDLRALSARTKVPLYEIQGVATFYPHFRRTAPPLVHVAVCRDLSCQMRDGGRAREALRALCDSREGVEFHEVSCLGRCECAPAAAVNEIPVDMADAPAFIENPTKLPDNEPTKTPRAWGCDPYPDAASRYGVLRDALKEPADWDAMIQTILDSGLRGMGGAGFPTGLKWKIVRAEAAEPKYVICNADESEPGTFKDRVILEELPHLVIEGMILGAMAIGAEKGWIYVRHEYAKETTAMRRAIREAYAAGVLGDDVCGTGQRFDLDVFVSPGGYILGEETALLEALEGKRGEPRNKPPYPGQFGLWGKPTLINNVETLSQIPSILRTGAHKYKFFSVSGDVAEPGVHEVAAGETKLSDLIELCGGMRDGKKLQAFLPGGASTGFLSAQHKNIVMDWKPLQAAGSALGSGAVVIVSEGRDMLALARNITAFFRNESCGKCVPCRIGTEKAVTMIDGGDPEQLARMGELHETLLETSICGLGQAALIPIQSVLKHFHDADAE